MKKISSKSSTILSIGFAMLLIILFIGPKAIKVINILYFHNANMWAHSADFDNYESDFIVVKDYVNEHYSSYNEKWFILSNTEEHGVTLYDPDTKLYIDTIPNEVRESLTKINSYGFPYKGSVLDHIEISGNRISFGIENGTYALVFSPDNKPTWLNSPNEAIDIKVKKCGDGWYHVIKDPN